GAVECAKLRPRDAAVEERVRQAGIEAYGRLEILDRTKAELPGLLSILVRGIAACHRLPGAAAQVISLVNRTLLVFCVGFSGRKLIDGPAHILNEAVANGHEIAVGSRQACRLVVRLRRNGSRREEAHQCEDEPTKYAHHPAPT